MTVITIIGLVAALAVWRLRFNADQRCPENAAGELQSIVREARTSALALGNPIGIIVYATHIETFTWNDADVDGLFEWTDGDGDGVFDDGEGEVEQALRTLSNERLCSGSTFQGQLNFRMTPAGAGVTCNSCGTNAANPDLAFFLAPHGVLMNPDATLCGLDVQVFNPDDGQVFGRVQTTPAGNINRAGTMTWL